MKRFLIIFFLSLILTSCNSEIQVNIPINLVETKIPKAYSEDWYKLNNGANKEFGVSITNNKLIIKEFKNRYEAELKIDDGKLLGINQGEWGGTLSFIPKNKEHGERLIKKGNIKYIFEFNNRIYFIEGLAHLSYSGGAIFELTKDANNFTFEKKLEFDDAPEAFTIYKNKILIATHKNFYVVENFEKELIFENTFWTSLYPNSIAVVDNENVYMGIRSGLVKLNLSEKTIIFYKNVE
ncbi:hypothetical protein [Tenacibaculum sp. 190524A05c]|uniref:hypothetical protein n=1 Tax=Tenacibaculum platacis TaxID=3137852 RepID=UPI0031FB1E83